MKIMKNKRGFTLFELLVSISIIAILTVIAMVSYSSAQQKARDAKAIQDVDAVGKALEQYYSDSNPAAYPVAGNQAALVPNYIQQLPTTYKVGYDFFYDLAGCYCVAVEAPDKRGNSTDKSCTLAAPSAGTLYYCHKGQQE